MRPAPPHQDQPAIVVLGAGPAAWLAAAACAEAGLSVTLVGPDVAAPWPARYGAFVDELESTGLLSFADRVWSALDVAAAGQRRRVARGYARVDGAALQAALRERLLRQGGAVREGVAQAVTVEGVVQLGSGEDLHGAVIVDASGAPGRTPGPTPRSFQHAYGEERTLPGGDAAARLGGSGMLLMDWSPPDAGWQGRWQRRPSFLYAMALDDDHIFCEETELIAATPLPHDELRARLHARLHRMELLGGAVSEVERCRLPMTLTAAPLAPRVVDFGARAGCVHPTTGYSLTRAACLAPTLATALQRALAASADGQSAAAAGREALSAQHDRGAEALLQLGAVALQGMNGRQISSFFGAFFGLPPGHWTPLLARGAALPQLALAMARVFAASPASVRGRLLAAGWQSRAPILHALAPRSVPLEATP